jgi:hypothetical protein
MIFGSAYWISANAPLIQPAIYKQSCVPGTRVQSTDYDLVREPTGSEVAVARARIQKGFSEAGHMIDAESLDFNAQNSAEMDIVRAASYEECFSAAKLIENLIIALFVALSLAPIFLIIRWVARGFASKAQGS